MLVALARCRKEFDLLALISGSAAIFSLDVIEIHLLGVLTRREEGREVVLLIQSGTSRRVVLRGIAPLRPYI